VSNPARTPGGEWVPAATGEAQSQRGFLQGQEGKS